MGRVSPRQDGTNAAQRFSARILMSGGRVQRFSRKRDSVMAITILRTPQNEVCTAAETMLGVMAPSCRRLEGAGALNVETFLCAGRALVDAIR
jgi:hypothetical protein